ncbi:hydroxyacid dehydrogenase [Noviherbaspirillum malthae]|jgi:D-3-phosphoglycerate dehydrogenase|uniref:hydroxyacid dehydrogenase n=1 Tax=Noviherbaspirillum malthae TaxID=1260987 RepID=UPI00188F87D7|nr:hydroxyacid dehydrogenase [Noviherbaspirillum malthae]
MSASAHKPVLLVTSSDLASQAVEMLESFDLVYAGKNPDEGTLVALCEQHQPVAMIVRFGKIPARVMDASKKLRVISKHGAGIDSIDTAAAAERGILVRAAAGANAAAVAEHAWAMIFACAKSLVQLNGRMHDGHWDKSTHKSLELQGKTLGLVGFGAIGQRTAAVGLALGMRVMVFDPFVSNAPEGVEVASLDEVLSQSEVISLHCPLTSDNRNLINRETISRMRDGVIIVNTARGGLVDEEAVIEAIRAGKIRAAGLDSFHTEPLTGEHHFTGVPNLILTPHVGGGTTDAYVNMGTAAARNVLDALKQ